MKKNLQWKLTAAIMAIQLISGLIVSLILLFAFFLDIKGLTFLLRTPLMLPFVCLVVSLVFSAFIALPVSRYILKPIRQLNDATFKVAQGDFSVRVTVPRGRGEFSEMFENFNKMTEELGHTELFRKDFINNFSHEFKTPIVSIRGFAKQLKLDDSLTEEQKQEYIDLIVMESGRLSTLSNNILLLSKLENQEYVTEYSTFYLDEQLRHAILLLEKQWMEKELKLQIDMEEIPYTTDESMLLQVWLNLLSNAIKFSKQGGTLHVTLKRAKDGIVASVGDEGEGIDRKDINRIFDKFYQADRSRKTAGNGLGLSLVKRICELLNCRVTVRSEKGKGSTFSIFLPET